jgi:hypothetical protein
MRKNVASQRVTFSLFKSSARVDNPTIAAGDFKVALDAGAQNNVSALPTSDAAGLVTWLPSQAETNGDTITLLAKDAVVAGNDWEPLTITFDTRDATAIGLYLDAAVSATAQPGDAMTLTAGERITTAAVVLTQILEGVHTVGDGLRIMLAALAGKSTGGGTLTNRFRDVADSKNRIDATVTANGDRSAVIIDGT